VGHFTRRRAVVTGIGLITPLGIGTDETWRGLMGGRSGIGPVTRFDATPLESRIAGEVKGFEPTRWIAERDIKTMDRFIHIAVAAAEMALADAGLPKADLGERAGCYLGVALGGAAIIEQTVNRTRDKGPRFGIKPSFLPAMLPNMAAGVVAMRFGVRGPVLCHATACASGAHAIGEGLRTIQRGDADVMLAGGSEAPITLVSMGGFCSLRLLSRRNDRPSHACRPFDLHRDGFVIAEGAGLLVLEELERARSRGARIHAELTGYGLSSDASHPTAPSADGEGASRAMQMALADASSDPARIGYVNAHGTGTALNDAIETRAIHRTFGAAARRLMISSTKSMTGHMLAGAGAVEAGISILAVARGEVPPTINLMTRDPCCDLDYVPNEARQQRIDASLSNSFGFGGVNASLLFARF
jgi:3-oxoacyl-[acyl-carrier-protein] synthase II